MKLLVELKPHGGEPANYVDLFVHKMRELGLKDYPAMSLDLSVIEKVEKKLLEKTGHVIPIHLAVSNDSIDFSAIKDFSYQGGFGDLVARQVSSMSDHQ